ncbi:APC family permease [Alkalitalea saponilacus]|uniref:Basic amino acid/polyamine antiporter, APA family n=1 Tax=Alkalitalea saponilacus TaxID=889453 RepID=A0A1T5BHQ1_9BACT|nr:amino acid permease [Alkalitalea saponilacus]ASB49693.1 amino acid permease [Alkalitalea saponilacus]SKB46353.1 basic amino acid/polyamine antiporter, APA family [Alkalitalea saponilacus]
MDDFEQGSDGVRMPRVIGPMAGFTVVAGSMLGVGIFLFPSAVASETGSLLMFFLIWLLGGLFAYSGAVACGELGAMLPKAGGDYVFQKEAYGDSVAFASGWVLFVTIFGGSIAGMAVAVFQYQISALSGLDMMANIAPGIPLQKANFFAVLLILLITAINYAGTRIAARTQILFTLIPILFLIFLAGYAVLSGWSVRPDQSIQIWDSSVSAGGVITAFLFVNFAYSGWLNIIYVAGEVKDPGRNIPKSMTWATVVVTVLYVLMCAAFVFSLGFEGLSSLKNMDAGTAMARALNSPVMANLVLITITVAIVTSLNATILTSARVAFAMAKERAFWAGAARLNKMKVPGRALWVQAIFAIFLVLTGSFYAIIEMASIAMFITGSLTVLALFVLRVKQPNRFRPYKATGYPWLPVIYLLFSAVALLGAVRQAFLTDGISGFYPFMGVAVLILAYIGHRFMSNRGIV